MLKQEDCEFEASGIARSSLKKKKSRFSNTLISCLLRLRHENSSVSGYYPFLLWPMSRESRTQASCSLWDLLHRYSVNIIESVPEACPVPQCALTIVCLMGGGGALGLPFLSNRSYLEGISSLFPLCHFFVLSIALFL